MKKVGIITFHNTNNYGAVLQCYALQKALRNNNIDAIVLNYTADMLLRPFGITALRKKGIIRYLLGNVYSLIRLPRNKKFNEFRRLIQKTTCLKKLQLKNIVDEYDYFITGSDQVWNGELTNYDDAYFLKFVSDPKKKLSYAASFGMGSLPDEKKTLYKHMLKDFSIINVREKSAVDIIKNILGREAKLTIDPTLLLSSEEWDRVAMGHNLGKYILVYQISPSKNLAVIAKKISRKTGYPVIAIPFVIGKLIAHKMILNAGPSEWIYYMKNAEYIVTDSFHGTVFSTIYNRKFLSCVPADESRIASFLKLMHLENRLVSSDELPEQFSCIDFSYANYRILEERTSALKILNMMINGEKRE